MYKHECVECLLSHGLKCIWNVSFINRFFGTDEVKYCTEYNAIIKHKNKLNGRGKKKK